VNVLILDEFVCVDLFDDKADFWKVIMQPHNGHVMPLGKLEYYAIAKLTAMDSKILMYLTVFSLWLPYFFIIKKLDTNNKVLAIGCIALIYLAFYSPIGWENLLWGWQIAYMSAYSFAIIAIIFGDYFLRTKKTQYLVLASISCFIASLNSGQGILSWLSIFMVMVYSKEYRKCFFAFVPSILIVAIYLYVKSGITFMSTEGVYDLPYSTIPKFFLAFLSSSVWSFNLKIAWLAAFITLLIICYLFVFEKVYRNYLFSSLVLLGILISGMITFSRWRFGANYVFCSRYFQLQMPIYLALALYLGCYKFSKFWTKPQFSENIFNKYLVGIKSCKNAIIVVLVFIFIVFFIFGSISNFKTTIADHKQLLKNVEILTNFDAEDKKTVEENVFPNYDYVKGKVYVLREKKLNCFTD